MDLDELLGAQDGVLTRAQALEHVGAAGLRHRIRAGGPWRRLLPGVYLASNGHPTRRQLLRAALLHAGDRAVLAGPTALQQHGLALKQTPSAVQLLVPHAVRLAPQPLVVVRRSRGELRSVLRDGLPTSPLPRAVLDSCRMLSSQREVRDLVASAVQQRRTTVGQLQAELGSTDRRGLDLARRVLHEVSDGVRSVAEAELRDLFGKSSVLPPARWNCSLLHDGAWLADPDAYFEEAGLCVESDSQAWHLSPDDWDATLARHLRMEATGLHVLHVTPGRRRTSPSAVLRYVEAAYVAASRSGPPPGIEVRERGLTASAA